MGPEINSCQKGKCNLAGHTHHTQEPHIIPSNDDNHGQPPPKKLAPSCHRLLQNTEAVDGYVGTQFQKDMDTNAPDTNVPHIVPSNDDQTPSTACSSSRAQPTRSTEYHRRAYNLPSTKNLIEYLHGTIGLPVKSTLLRAVKAGNFQSFPGLSVSNVERYGPTNAAPTVLGHLTQVQKGLRSTRWGTADCSRRTVCRQCK